jgi:hypothetical protein
MRVELRRHPTHEGLYVTPDARVFRELAASPSSGNYHTVKLPKGTVRRHTLVLETYGGLAPFVGAEVRHKDGNPLNDAPTNLEWGTRAQNAGDAIRHGTTARGERSAQAKLTRAQAADILRRRRAGERGTELAAEYGVSPQTVCDLKAGRTWPELQTEVAT